MPSRLRDQYSHDAFSGPGFTTPRTPALDRSEPSYKRSTTHRLPIPDDEGLFGGRSRTRCLPVFDADDAFHTRVTPPRLPVLGEAELDDEYFPAALSAADFTFIAGPVKPGALRPERWKTRLTIKLLARLAMLPVALVLLLGAQGFIAQVSRDCASAQARQQQNCLALSLFTALSGSKVGVSPAPAMLSPTAKPKLPPIPNDLPANVHGFLVIALPYAVQAHQALGWPTSVILAQWGLEHGWDVPDAQGYNWGNTTFAPGCPYRGSRFCYAATPAEGLREYVYTARLDFYTAIAPAAKQGGADAAAQALGRSPWDAAHYANMGQPGALLLAIMHDFNLYRLDSSG
jgi:hypothetical protein